MLAGVKLQQLLLLSPDMKSYTIFMENNKTQVFESNVSIVTHTVEVFFMSIVIDTSNMSS